MQTPGSINEIKDSYNVKELDEASSEPKREELLAVEKARKVMTKQGFFFQMASQRGSKRRALGGAERKRGLWLSLDLSQQQY